MGTVMALNEASFTLKIIFEVSIGKECAMK